MEIKTATEQRLKMEDRNSPSVTTNCQQVNKSATNNSHHSHSIAYTITNRRLVSKIFVIVNVTTLFINLPPNKHAAEAATTTAIQSASSPTHHHHHQLSQQKQNSSPNHATSHLQNQRLAQQIEEHHQHHHQQQHDDHSNNQNQHSNQASETNENNDNNNNNNLETNALNYLQKYGYMNTANTEANNNLISEDSFSSAIAQFQRFAGLPETGLVDNQTLRLMQTPRCGNADQVHQRAPLRQSQRPRAPLLTIERSALAQSSSLLQSRRRRKRYALQGSKWRRQELTYRISQYPTRFSGKRHEVDSQIEKAFGIWSQVAPIDFVVKKEGRVHIDIRFASGDHGDGDAFDGPGNTLAHAYFPQYGGDAHFDDQEYWTIDSYAGTNIFQVAAHELGHSLGLGHSNVREALMAPFYQKYKPNFKLHIDDVLAIQALYGEKPYLGSGSSTEDLFPAFPSNTHQSHSTTTATPTTPPTSTHPSTTTNPPTTTTQSKSTTKFPLFGSRSRPGIIFGSKPESRETNEDDENQVGSSSPDLSSNGFSGGGNGIGSSSGPADSEGAGSNSGSSYPADLCFDSTIDTVTRTEDGNSYVFKGDFYWLLTSEGLAKDYPRRIATDWDGLPGSIDAALTWADGKTFFFKGNKYWRYRNKRRDIGYPKLISAGFAGIPDNIDAAFVWSGNGRTYIFKGTEYWRFDSKADPPVSSEYPRSIKVWNGVPSYVNAAFKWENNVTYFFKGSQYYRFNDKEFKVESRGRPPFPRQSSEWWFGCVNSNLANQRALSSSLREQNSLENNLVKPQQHDSSASDWSFFGEGAINHQLGTHISDHKPGSFQSTVNNSVNNVDVISQSSDDTGPQGPPFMINPQTGTNFGHRIGFFNPAYLTPSITTASSSAISLAQQSRVVFSSQYNYQFMALMLLSSLSAVLMNNVGRRHSYLNLLIG